MRSTLFLFCLGLVFVAQPAMGAIIVGPDYSSRVDATVTPTNGLFNYQFEVFNTTPALFQASIGFSQVTVPVIMDWELPLFSLDDLDVNSITSPTGWQYEIVAHPNAPSFWNYSAANDPLLDPNQGGDPNLYGPNPEVFENPPYVLHWFTDDPESYGIFPQGSLGGFGFLSQYSPFNAPYLASWVDLPPRGGDPPVPGQAFGTPLSPARFTAQRFPEPSTISLIAVGSGLLWLAHRRRVRRRA